MYQMMEEDIICSCYHKSLHQSDFKEVTCIKDKSVKVIRMLKSTVYPDLMLK